MAQRRPGAQAMMLMLFFIAGAILGVATYRAWTTALVELARREGDLLARELHAEIMRLRAQVAKHVGRE
jgi:hypothetical protein